VSFFRYDTAVRSPLGQVIAGADIAVLTQPAVFPGGENVAGTPLAEIWSANTSNDLVISGASWSQGLLTFLVASLSADVVPGSYVSVIDVVDADADENFNQIWQVEATVAVPPSIVVSSLTNPGTYVSGGTAQTSALPNPFQTDNLGNAFFYAASGFYTVQIFDPTYNRISPLVLIDQAVLSPGGGSVMSVAMTGDGVVFLASVPGSPVTTSGTLAPALASPNANFVLAGPASGGPGPWTARRLVAADLGSLGSGTVTSVAVSSSPDSGGILAPGVSGSPITTSGTIALTVQFNPQPANTALLGPTAGGSATPAFRAITTADLPNMREGRVAFQPSPTDQTNGYNSIAVTFSTAFADTNYTVLLSLAIPPTVGGWVAGATLVEGDAIIDPNGNLQVIGTGAGGTGGGTIPTFNTVANGTTTDGTATWRLYSLIGNGIGVSCTKKKTTTGFTVDVTNSGFTLPLELDWVAIHD